MKGERWETSNRLSNEIKMALELAFLRNSLGSVLIRIRFSAREGETLLLVDKYLLRNFSGIPPRVWRKSKRIFKLNIEGFFSIDMSIY